LVWNVGSIAHKPANFDVLAITINRDWHVRFVPKADMPPLFTASQIPGETVARKS
jgi:hypothetical protein